MTFLFDSSISITSSQPDTPPAAMWWTEGDAHTTTTAQLDKIKEETVLKEGDDKHGYNNNNKTTFKFKFKEKNTECALCFKKNESECLVNMMNKYLTTHIIWCACVKDDVERLSFLLTHHNMSTTWCPADTSSDRVIRQKKGRRTLL